VQCPYEVSVRLVLRPWKDWLVLAITHTKLAYCSDTAPVGLAASRTFSRSPPGTRPKLAAGRVMYVWALGSQRGVRFWAGLFKYEHRKFGVADV